MTVVRHLTALPLLALALPAAAHHPMGGTTPATLTEGLLSGFGHPVIGFDHLIFILAVGVACYCVGRRRVAALATITAFLVSALAGTLLHLQVPDVPYADAWVAVSLCVLGVLFFRRSEFLQHPAALALFAVSGLMHGYAYGEAIVGAETTPLLAYLVGFTLMQFSIALGGYALAHYFTTRKPAVVFFKAAGGALAATGAGFLLFSFAG